MKRILLIIVIAFGLVAAAIDVDTSIHPGSALMSASATGSPPPEPPGFRFVPPPVQPRD